MSADLETQRRETEERAVAREERRTLRERFADRTPSRKSVLIEKRNSVGLLAAERAELTNIELAEMRQWLAADVAAERVGEGRLLPVGRTNFKE